MSTELLLVSVVVALALAVQSVRRVVSMPAPERGSGWLLLLAAAALGGLLAGSLIAWDMVAVGVVVGLGLLEVSPIIARAARRRVGQATGEPPEDQP